MNINQFAEKLFAAGRSEGFADMEIYFQSGSQFRIGVFKGELDSYSLAEDSGLSFRGLYNGKMGYAYTEKIDDSSIDMLIDDARQNAQVIDSEDTEEIFAGSDSYELLDGFSETLAGEQPKRKIELVKDLEKAAYALDERVATVQAWFGDGQRERTIINTKGLNLSFKGNSAGIGLSVVVRQGQETKTAHESKVGKDLLSISVREISRRGVEEAVSLFGAETVPSKSYPIILRKDVAAHMLAVFSSSFSAENVQKGMSLLKDRIGEQIFSEQITVTDDPTMADRPGSTPFDAEGVATTRKNVVENGKLTTYLHNLKTARKDGAVSTGNASKGSYKSPIGIAPTNLYIQPGDRSYDEIVAGTKEGIIIISLQGTHSGANPVSGDFSLGAYGYLVQDGKVTRPVDQITVAGNYFQMMREVEEVGNDLDFGSSNYGSPTLKIKQLAVAGK